MDVVAVIPARYASSRFPGKPLTDICGKPMLWWVYQQAIESAVAEQVYVAADDDRIRNMCETYGIPCIMTAHDCGTHIERVKEVSDSIQADYYVVICGDEPLIEPEVIPLVLPRDDIRKGIYVAGLCRYFSDPAEVIDPANIKVVTNSNDDCIMLTRATMPFPYKSIMFKYKKLVGVECYNKQALDYFAATPKGWLESIEDVTLQRYIENGIRVKYRLVETCSLSVDTPKDAAKVIKIMNSRGGFTGCP